MNRIYVACLPRAVFRSIVCVMLFAVLISACNNRDVPSAAADKQSLLRQFNGYIERGNAVYAEKNGYTSFRNSLLYFDSAQAMAEIYKDTFMMINAVFARGRIYDAWNKEPEKTIFFFSKAAALLKAQSNYDFHNYVYLQQLIAHAYEKNKDTAEAVAQLRSLYRELMMQSDTLRDSINSIPEMAQIATQVGAWSLADSILQHLSSRALIANDPNTYNYLDHYYLTRLRIDIFGKQYPESPYLDSVQQVADKTANLADKIFYLDQLYRVYEATGRYRQALEAFHAGRQIDDSINGKGSLTKLQQALVASEIKAGHWQLEYERRAVKRWNIALGVITCMMILLTLLTCYLLYRNREFKYQSERVQQLNRQLDDKIELVELLNKETQHRLKNNLNMIYSLLQMQERTTPNKEVAGHLLIARMRVESIAALQQQLQGSGADLDLSAFISGLVPAIIRCFSYGRTIHTHINVDSVSVSQSKFLYIGLILNEWVTNAIKYATKEAQSLELFITVERREDHVYLYFRDNGAAPQTQAESGLGTQIVSLLCKQLAAGLKSPDGHPYHYQLCLQNG